MKIAFLHRDLPPENNTGVATQVHRLAQALIELGESVEVFTMTRARPGWTPAYRIHTIDLPQLELMLRLFPAGKRLWYPLFFRALDFSGFDLVHVHGDGVFLPYTATQSPRPDHSAHLPQWARTFYGSAYYERKYGSSLKSWLAQTLSWLGEKRESRICPHQCAIAAHVRQALPRVTEVIPCMLAAPVPKLVPLKSTQPSLIHVGSLYGRKQGHQAIAIWKNLRASGQSWHLHLVCPLSEAEAARRSVGNHDATVHSGLSAEALQQLYAESWVALSTAHYEGFGLTLIEALAQGCMPLAKPHLGAVDVLGHLAPDCLAELDAMPGILRQWGQAWHHGPPDSAALMEMARVFEPQAIARRYLAWYHRIIEKTRP